MIPKTMISSIVKFQQAARNFLAKRASSNINVWNFYGDNLEPTWTHPLPKSIRNMYIVDIQRLARGVSCRKNKEWPAAALGYMAWQIKREMAAETPRLPLPLQ